MFSSSWTKNKKADFKRYEEELIKKDFQQNVADDDSLEIQSKYSLLIWKNKTTSVSLIAFIAFRQVAFHTMNIRRMCNNLEEFRKKVITITIILL